MRHISCVCVPEYELANNFVVVGYPIFVFQNPFGQEKKTKNLIYKNYNCILMIKFDGLLLLLVHAPAGGGVLGIKLHIFCLSPFHQMTPKSIIFRKIKILNSKWNSRWMVDWRWLGRD